MLKIYLRIYISTVHTYNPNAQERLDRVSEARKPVILLLLTFCSLVHFCSFRVDLLSVMSTATAKQSTDALEDLLFEICSQPANKPIGGESDGQMCKAKDLWLAVHDVQTPTGQRDYLPRHTELFSS